MILRIYCLMILVIAAALSPFVPAAAWGQTQAVSITGGSTWAGGGDTGYSVGWQFSVNDTLSVTDLGVFDADGSGLSQAHTVRLYDLSHNSVLATATIPQNTPGVLAGAYNAHYVPLNAPVTLTPGTSYIVAKQAGQDNYRYDAEMTLGSGINWIAGKAVAGILPASASAFDITNPGGSFFGATFQYTTGVPSQPANTLTLSMPSRTIYQRDANNSANVSIKGSYTGTISRIEARIVPRGGCGVADWMVIDAAPSGGIFNAQIPLTGGWYDIEVRTIAGGVVVAITAATRIGVGEVFITAGQSNSANYGTPQQTPSDDRVCNYNPVTGIWQLASDPQPFADGVGGSPWPHMGDLLAAKYNVPVGIVAVGVGGTSIGQWQVGGYYSRIYIVYLQLDFAKF